MQYVESFVSTLATILSIAIVGRTLLSWVNLGNDHRLVIIVYQITEPILGPIRRLLPKTGDLDFSPIVAMVGLVLIPFVIGKIAG